MAGDFVVTGASRPALVEVARQTGVDFTTASGVSQGAHEIRKSRIAMYQRYAGGNTTSRATDLLVS